MNSNVGSKLREARESKGITIQEASESLFIRVTYLEALENDRKEIIPSMVQARGFVRMYSDYLGLDTDQILHEWDHPFEGTVLDNRNSTPTQHPPVVPLPNPPIPAPAPVPVPAFVPQPQPIGNNFPPEQPSPTQTENVQAPEPQKKKKKPSIFHRKKEKSNQVSASAAKDPIRDIFREIGSELGTRRKQMSLSIEDCETQTLIRSVYLESMESGDFDQLPSFIQGRGMLNNYATFLGLDTEKLMLKFADALQLLSQEKARAALSQSSKNKEKTYKPVKKAGKLKQFFTPDLFIGVFVILGMAFVICYSFYTITRYRRNISTTPTVDLNEIFIEQLNESTSAPVFLSTATSTPSIMSLNNTENENQEEEDTIDENSPVQLFIAADQRSYLKVISDGKDAFSGRTLPGNTYPFDAQNLIEVIVGNADAVSFTYNQQNIGKLGKLGEVLDLQFGPYTVITPTPQFSPTPTLTLQPTYTSVPETPIPTLTPTPYIP